MSQLFNEHEDDWELPWDQRRKVDHNGIEYTHKEIQDRYKNQKAGKAKKTFVFCGGRWQDHLEIIPENERSKEYPGSSILRWKNLRRDDRMSNKWKDDRMSKK